MTNEPTTAFKSCLEQLAQLVDGLHKDEFPAQLAASLQSLVACDSMVVMAYRENSPPVVLFDGIHSGDWDSFFGIYLQGAYLLSPLYASFKKGEEGFFHLPDVAPQGFFDSEFYARYYGYTGLKDQVFFLYPLADGACIAISIGRTDEAHPFTPAERQQLSQIEAVLGALVRHHWPALASSASEGKPALNLQLQSAFDNFGCSLLTERERDVVQLILRGHSSKSAARELNITPDTERVHRRNAYAKLEVSSQAELFSLFFDAITCVSLDDSQDPLQSYRNQSTRNQ